MSNYAAVNEAFRYAETHRTILEEAIIAKKKLASEQPRVADHKPAHDKEAAE